MAFPMEVVGYCNNPVLIKINTHVSAKIILAGTTRDMNLTSGSDWEYCHSVLYKSSSERSAVLKGTHLSGPLYTCI